MGAWRRSKLIDVAAKKRWALNGGPFGSKLTTKHYTDSGVPVIRGTNLSGSSRFSFGDFVWVSEEKADELLPNNAHPGDLVFTQRGTIGQVGLIPLNAPFKRFVISQSQMKLTPDPERADALFLYYYFSSPDTVKTIENLAFAAGVPHINLEILRNFEVPLPPLTVQRQIAGVLSTYDDLIENCERRIRILETMARTLYREWFVHFRFPGHENYPRIGSPLGDVPKGWEVRNVKDVATVTYGFPFASKKFNTDGVGTPVIRIRDILEGFSSTFTEEEAEPRHHVQNGHILVGMDGDFHMCIWSGGHAFQNQRVARFESNSEIGNFHLFLALEKPIQAFNKAIVGTTVAHLGDMHIKTIQIIWPPQKLRDKARAILEPISAQIIALKCQIRNLRQTRDLLLPRFLSGQIQLADEKDVVSSIVNFPSISQSKKTQKATEEFVEAVVIAQLTRLLATPQYPLGRLRYNKLAYLAHRKSEDDVKTQYLKKAAGPYSPWAKYGGPEQIALRNGYVKHAKSGQFEGFVPGEHIDKVDAYLSRYPVCASISWVVDKFRYRKKDDLELLATVDFAALDLLQAGLQVTKDEIKQVIATNQEWAPKLNRKIFSDANISRALTELGTLFPSTYSPSGVGRTGGKP